MKKIVQCNFVRLLTFVIFFVILFNANTRVFAAELMQISNGNHCHKNLQRCISLKNFTVKKENQITFFDDHYALVEFNIRLDLEKLRRTLQNSTLKKLEQRLIIQRLLTQLNKQSITQHQSGINRLEKSGYIDKRQAVSITNGMLLKLNSELDDKDLIRQVFTHHQDTITNHQKHSATTENQWSNNPSPTTVLQGNQLAHQQIQLSDSVTQTNVQNVYIALVDSGVSLKHQELSHLTNLEQYNPEEPSYDIKDTGFGHGTGVLSLLAASNQHQRSISTMPDAHYLSCNGLPSGQYHYIWVVSCFDWIIQQPKVDIVVNSWLQPELSCNDELIYPLRALWLANSIPVFSAGNFGQEETNTRDPVNFNLFDDIPLLSIGAIDSSGQPLANSSHARNICQSEVNSPSLTAPGENLIVASPFQQDSYQSVSGTSYSVTYAATALAVLISQYPDARHHTIVNALLNTASMPAKTENKSASGHGKINLKKALHYLKKASPDSK